MDLNKKIIPETLFQKIIIGLMLIIATLAIWTGFTVFQSIQNIVAQDPASISKEGAESYSSYFKAESNSFAFIQTANLDTAFTYVTLTDLTFSPSKEESMNILTSSSSNEKILGLSSHPSFLVPAEDRSFWINQIYLEMGFLIGGIILIIFVLIWITSINFESYKKLFTKEIYHRVLTLFFIIFAGFMIDALLYARKINFLNNEYYLGLSPTAGISMTMLFILFLLLFVLIFVRKGIPMQNEQDLTV